MKCVILLLAAFMACVASMPEKSGILKGQMPKGVFPAPTKTKIGRQLQEGSIDQRIDHFDADNIQVFTQRFFANYEFYDVDDEGPIFIVVGGELPVGEYFLTNGYISNLADEHDAALFYLEHRFYGESFPEGEDADMDVLQYMTTEQALYDLAYFIESIQFVIPEFQDDAIILHGGSLGGSLVTWFQRDYNTMVAGAWASSAPILADADFAEGMEVSGAVLRSVGGQACYERVSRSFAALELEFWAENYDRIREVYNVCPQTNIESQTGQWVFHDVLAIEFASMLNFAGQEGLVDVMCQIMLNATTDLAALADFQAALFGTECLNFDYETTVARLRETEWQGPHNLRQRLWLWQRCSEYGLYPTSSSFSQPFGSGFPVDLFFTLCEDVFGEEFDGDGIMERVDNFNEAFGGLTPEVYNLISTQGRFDAHRPSGAQEHLSDTARVRIIDNAGPIEDMYANTIISEPEDLYAARSEIAGFIREWIRDFEATRKTKSQ